MKKVLYILALGFLFLGFLGACTPTADSDGSITITVLDIDGEQLGSKEVEFFKGDTFVEVLERSNFGFEFSAPGDYGVSVLEILDTTLGATEYWSHSINGEYSMTGVSSQEFADGDVFIFQVIDWSIS
jgi:hypothetical protein